jgi:hypothetical protein
MAKGCGNEAGHSHQYALPRNRNPLYGRAGTGMALHPNRLVPSVVRHVKESKGHLRQHKTCDTSNAGTGASSRKGRVADTQCWHRGREAVVAVGVTSHRGCGQRRSGAKGLRPDQFHDIQTRLALGRIMEIP